MEPVIELSDICFAYAGVPVLRHVCGTVEQGEAVGITGPNGAGKSTLLRLLNGLIFPEQGTYRFFGEQITAARLREIRFRKTFHQRLGLVWQDPTLQLFCGSVREELAFGPAQMGRTEQETAARVEDAAALFQLEDLLERAPYTLSGGEKRRVSLACILTMNPAVWTLDEPLSSLDTRTQELVVSFLRALRRAGKTILFSTHEKILLRELADRIWSLDERGTLKEMQPASG